MAAIVPDRDNVRVTSDVKGATVVTSTAIAQTTQERRSQLKVNEVLETGKSLVSQKGYFSFINQDDGNIVLYATTSSRPIWSSQTDGLGTGSLTMQADGNLVGKFWSTETEGLGNESSTFVVQDDGKAVILVNGKEIWRTGAREYSYRTPDDERMPLEVGYSLTAGQALRSSNGRYRFVVQAGNGLALYDTTVKDGSFWTAETNGIRLKLTLYPNGNLIVHEGKHRKWESNTAGRGDMSSALTVQDDGDVVLRSKDVVIWSTGTKMSGPKNPDRLLAGESLRSDQFLQSPNATYKLLLKADGSLFLYDVKDDNRRIWDTSDWSSRGIVRATLERNGNFVVYDNNKVHWSSKTGAKGDSTSVLSVQNDGDVVIRSKGVQIWATGTKQKTENLDRMIVGEHLVRGQSIKSPNGRFKFILQEDGDVVLYDIKDGKKRKLFASGSLAYGTKSLSLQKDGNLVLYGETSVRWSTETSGKGDESSILKIQDDGNVVLTSNGMYVWSTKTGMRQPVTGDRLTVGQSMGRDEALISPNGKYKLIFQDDGNFVLYDDGRAVWATNTRSWTTSVVLRDDDNLVLTGSEWSSRTRRRINGGTAVLIVQDNGKIALKSDGYIIWSNDSSLVNAPPIKYTAVSSGASQLRRGEYLAVNQFLTSPNGEWNARLQSDGNFVLRHRSSEAPLWTSNTAPNSAISRVVMQYDCNCVMYGANGSAVWATNTDSVDGGGTLELQDNGEMITVDGKQLEQRYQIECNKRPPYPQFQRTDQPQFPAFKGAIKQLKRGQKLLQGQSLTSPNGQYKLSFTDHGTLCITKDGQSTYYYTCLGRTNAGYLAFESDDQTRPTIRIFNSKCEKLWSAATRESNVGRRERSREQKDAEDRDKQKPVMYQPPTYDEPCFVLGDDGDAHIWFENDKIFSLFEQPKNAKGSSPTSPSCLRAGQTLLPSQRITSANDRYFCTFQSDCDLVMYHNWMPDPSKGYVECWTSGTKRGGFFKAGGKVYLQPDGALVMMDWTGQIKWYTPGGGLDDACAVMGDDGNLSTYVNGKRLWSTADYIGWDK